MKTTNEEADNLPQARSQGILASYKAIQEIQEALGSECKVPNQRKRGKNMQYHHILFTKDVWRSGVATKTLRHSHWLKVPLDNEVHLYLHKKVPFVPILDHYTALAVLRDWQPVVGDYYGSVISFAKTIENLIKSPKARLVQKQSARVTILALEQQLPFIKEGLIKEIK
jgi:hypothetical protein